MKDKIKLQKIKRVIQVEKRKEAFFNINKQSNYAYELSTVALIKNFLVHSNI